MQVYQNARGGGMTKDKLIVKQQLEIENLKQIIKQHIEGFTEINNRLVCIGGGLNDNILNYTISQRRQDLIPISLICESFLKGEDE